MQHSNTQCSTLMANVSGANVEGRGGQGCSHMARW